MTGLASAPDLRGAILTQHLLTGGRLLDPACDELLDGMEILDWEGTVREVSNQPIRSESATHVNLGGRTTIWPTEADGFRFWAAWGFALGQRVAQTWGAGKCKLGALHRAVARQVRPLLDSPGHDRLLLRPQARL